jgi:hypothetical protein
VACVSVDPALGAAHAHPDAHGGPLASVDVYGGLVGLFDALAVDDKGLRVVPGPLSQQRIAERVGATKAMVNRLLTDLIWFLESAVLRKC